MRSLIILISLLIVGVASASLIINPYAFGVSSAPGTITAFWKLDEATGADNRVDSGGNAQDLDQVVSQTSTNSVISLGASWGSGSGEYMVKTDSAALSCGDIDFTIAAWMLKYDGNPRGAINKGGLGSAAVIEYGLYTDGNSWKFAVSNGSTVTTVVSAAVSNGVWYYVVAWHDSTANTINIQVNNGTPVSAAHTVGCQDSTGDFTVGRAADGYQFNGALDEILFSKSILSDATKTYLYNAGAGRTCCPFP